MSKAKFFLAIIIVIVSAILFGFVLPALMSAKNNVTPLIAVGTIGLILIILVYKALDVFGFFNKRKENKE